MPPEPPFDGAFFGQRVRRRGGYFIWHRGALGSDGYWAWIPSDDPFGFDPYGLDPGVKSLEDELFGDFNKHSQWSVRILNYLPEWLTNRYEREPHFPEEEIIREEQRRRQEERDKKLCEDYLNGIGPDGRPLEPFNYTPYRSCLERYLPGPWLDFMDLRGDGKDDDRDNYGFILSDLRQYLNSHGSTFKEVLAGIVSALIPSIAGSLTADVILSNLLDIDHRVRIRYNDFVEKYLPILQEFYIFAYNNCVIEAAERYLGEHYMTDYPCEEDRKHLQGILNWIKNRKESLEKKYGTSRL